MALFAVFVKTTKLHILKVKIYTLYTNLQKGDTAPISAEIYRFIYAEPVDFSAEKGVLSAEKGAPFCRFLQKVGTPSLQISV